MASHISGSRLSAIHPPSEIILSTAHSSRVDLGVPNAFGTPRSTRDEWAVDKMISDGGWIALSRDPLMCDATDDDPYFPVRMAYQNNGYGVVSLP